MKFSYFCALGMLCLLATTARSESSAVAAQDGELVVSIECESLYAKLKDQIPETKGMVLSGEGDLFFQLKFRLPDLQLKFYHSATRFGCQNENSAPDSYRLQP